MSNRQRLRRRCWPWRRQWRTMYDGHPVIWPRNAIVESCSCGAIRYRMLDGSHFSVSPFGHHNRIPGWAYCG